MPGGVAELCLAVADHGGRLPHKKRKRRTHRGGMWRRGKPGKGHDTGVPDGAETEPDIPQLRPETDAEPDPGKPFSSAEMDLVTSLPIAINILEYVFYTGAASDDIEFNLYGYDRKNHSGSRDDAGIHNFTGALANSKSAHNNFKPATQRTR